MHKKNGQAASVCRVHQDKENLLHHSDLREEPTKLFIAITNARNRKIKGEKEKVELT